MPADNQPAIGEEIIALPVSCACCLPGYAVQLHQSGVKHSITKLVEAKESFDEEFSSYVPCSLHPCKTEEETLSYRCNCTFQLVLSWNSKFGYAMRTQGTVVMLQCSYFSIASRRIQGTMSAFLDALNSTMDIHDELYKEDDCTGISSSVRFQFPILRENLTSASFVSSWDERECLVTLHYAPPGLPAVQSKSSTAGYCNERWKQWVMQAEEVRLKCHATHLSGRSRRIHLSVPIMATIDRNNNDSVFFRDEIHLDFLEQQESNLHLSKVSYLKPERAFQHPNPRVMYQALNWLCAQMYIIRRDKHAPISLLEMYCGYGAHTIPLCKSKICDTIVAVEMDGRLAQACQANCVANQCGDIVRVVTADAGIVSRSLLNNARSYMDQKTKEFSQKSGLELKNDTDLKWLKEVNFDVLLVDPPRQGLDVTVCELIKTTDSFQNVFYVSCGRNALLRDLKLLNDTFFVKTITMLDLFPRTDSVETLVHLQRIHLE